jgi:serine/threonine-protein kinase
LPIEPGQGLLHYRIVEKLGEGGMGVVWKAVDTSLDREVAIKILPDAFAADAERLARFEREAKLLASLNHPNIAAIYGLHESGDSRFLSMELVPGEDLAQRLARGPISNRDAWNVAGQIADALETAHDSGVVHRDLKPANVKLTPEGKVKVLDFGLAKALAAEPSASGADPALLPTLTSTGTRAGVILGTAGYMSPEQARGAVVDQRTDNWAFGCLVFEMLAGRRPFDGSSVTDILAAVVRDEPDWNALPPETPAGIRRLLRHCLAKDPRNRLRNVGDAGLAVADAALEPQSVAAARSGDDSRPAGRALVWTLAFVCIAAIVTAVVAVTSRPGSISEKSTWVDLQLADMEGATNRWGTPPVALSPDGRTVAYEIHQSDVETRLAIRSLDSHELRVLPGTEGGDGPFFSPDGQWLGFFADNELRKVPLSGQGAVQSLHRFDHSVSILGAAWTPRQSIVFGIERVGLLEVPAAGGKAVSLTVPDVNRGEMHHGFPFVLPNGDDLLFTVGAGIGATVSRPALLSRDTGEWSTLLPDGQYGNQPRYLSSGHLVYASGDRILAAPFDLDQQRLTSSPVVVADNVHVDLGSGVTYFDLSASGALLYLPVVPNRLVWVDRQGTVAPILDVAGDYLHPRLSPDGTKIVLLSRKGADTDIWVVDVERQSRERLTRGGDHSAPLWTVDGEEVVFAQIRSNSTGIVLRRADGSGEPSIVLEDGNDNWPMTWSPDGRILAFERRTQGGARDLWASIPGQDEPPRMLLGTTSSEESPRISPDGRWLAYVSNHTGDYEVYVASFPALDRQWQISSGGGTEPVWDPRGHELYYRVGRQVLTASVTAEGGVLRVGRPKLLFEGFYNLSRLGHAHYDVAPDGQRFVMVEEDPQAFESLRLILHWDRDLLPSE